MEKVAFISNVLAPKGAAPNDMLMPVCHLFCLSAMHIPCHPVLHGLEGSAWARSLEMPL